MHITPREIPPDRLAATGLSFVAVEGTPITLDLLTPNRGPRGSGIRVVMVTQPANGSVSPIAPHLNEVGYLPAPGFRGLDRFTYTITDADGRMAAAPVNITVIAE